MKKTILPEFTFLFMFVGFLYFIKVTPDTSFVTYTEIGSSEVKVKKFKDDTRGTLFEGKTGWLTTCFQPVKICGALLYCDGHLVPNKESQERMIAFTENSNKPEHYNSDLVDFNRQVVIKKIIHIPF